MINSNNTQRNSDHDFTKLRKRALGNQGGVESKEQFIFDNDTKKLSAGSDIATAYILCTRPASNPIPNQKFLAQFEFTGSLDFLNITNGDKIFIEIKENLVKDPTLIEDLDGQTNYNQGLGIWEIKMGKNYPSHSNYLKLYEWNEGKLVDLRKAISLPALDEVAQRTTSLEQKASQAEKKIEKLEEGNWADHLEKKLFTSESVSKNDALIIEHAFSSTNTGKSLPIGQTEQTKELTIPRIASGKKGKILQLCLAKVWSPTQDVIIELKKGVKKTEFGKELWAGWEVLATGRIPHATVQWTAVHTITLNKEVSLNPGELVCVSIKQDKGTINTSNYYQIIIDNHPTIGQGVYWWDKKTFFNAFCNSELFLSEFFSTQKVIEIKRTWTLTWFAITANHSFYKMIAPYSAIDVEATISLNKKRNPNGNGGRGAICISVFGNIASFDRSTLIEQKKLSFSLNPTLFQELEIRQYQNSNNFGDSIASAEVDISVKMKIKDIRSHSILYAREDKALWESLVATLFGFHDGKWVGPQIDTANPTASATTGTIPPGNYVTYLTVIGPDGKKYKVWAYAE